MEGAITEGWFRHPQQGLIRIFKDSHGDWVYQCYSDNGSRVLSRERDVDQWLWALSQEAEG